MADEESDKDGLREVITQSGVTIGIAKQNWSTWNWGVTPEKLLQGLRDSFGNAAQLALDELVDSVYVSARINEKNIGFEVVGFDGEFSIKIDGSLLVDDWILDCSTPEGKFLRYSDSVEEGQDLINWLESQAARVREVIAGGIDPEE